jgi:hypothetical protein
MIHELSLASRTLGVVGSDPTRGMDSVCSFCVYFDLCTYSGLATGLSPVQGTHPTMYRVTKLEKAKD